MSILIVHRDSGYADRARKYRVYCGSKKIGVVGNDQVVSFHIPPGQHEICFRIDWARSNKILVNFEQGKKEVIKVGSSLRGWKLLLAVYYVTFGYYKYLWAKHEVS